MEISKIKWDKGRFDEKINSTASQFEIDIISLWSNQKSNSNESSSKKKKIVFIVTVDNNEFTIIINHFIIILKKINISNLRFIIMALFAEVKIK